MNKRLFFLRHAKAEEFNKDIKDFERDLTVSGIEDAYKMSKWLVNNYPSLDLIITSMAKRAKFTAEIFYETFEKKPEFENNEELYQSTLRTLLVEISHCKPFQNAVMIVGHNPTISYVADYYSDTPIDTLPTCSLAILNFENCNSWEDLQKGKGKLEHYKTPKN